MKIPRYASPELVSLKEAMVLEASVHFYVGPGRGGGRSKCRNRDDGQCRQEEKMRGTGQNPNYDTGAKNEGKLH
jgi:hypothetical protein